MQAIKSKPTPQLGVLLINLGTPSAPTAGAVRRYLAEFLWDKRVVRLPRLLWWFILNIIILTFRPAKVAKNYQEVSTAPGPPPLAFSQEIPPHPPPTFATDFSQPVPVSLAMTYGQPSMQAAIKELQQQGVEKLVVLPLYPQYSSSTTAAAFDALAKAFTKTSYLPAINFVRSYASHPLYIQALAKSVTQAEVSFSKLVMSFHGVPKNYIADGDNYTEECEATAKLLAEELKLQPENWQLTYQSRFGKGEWLQPFTDFTMKELGTKQEEVAVICPGFSADCLETLEEIQVENKDYFTEAGGKVFSYVPCLNAMPEHIELLAQLVKENS